MRYHHIPVVWETRGPAVLDGTLFNASKAGKTFVLAIDYRISVFFYLYRHRNLGAGSRQPGRT